VVEGGGTEAACKRRTGLTLGMECGNGPEEQVHGKAKQVDEWELDWDVMEALLEEGDAALEKASADIFLSSPSADSIESAAVPAAFPMDDGTSEDLDHALKCAEWNLRHEASQSSSTIYQTHATSGEGTHNTYTELASATLLANHLDALANRYRSYAPSDVQKQEDVHPLVQKIYDLQNKYVKLIVRLEDECQGLCRGLVYTYVGRSAVEGIPFQHEFQTMRCRGHGQLGLSAELQLKQATIRQMLLDKKQKCLEHFERHVEEEIKEFVNKAGSQADGSQRHISVLERGRTPFKLQALKEWLSIPENFLHPYPDSQVKAQLAEKCGMTYKQVTDWFTNFRLRKWKRIIMSEEEQK